MQIDEQAKQIQIRFEDKYLDKFKRNTHCAKTPSVGVNNVNGMTRNVSKIVPPIKPVFQNLQHVKLL